MYARILVAAADLVLGMTVVSSGEDAELVAVWISVDGPPGRLIRVPDVAFVTTHGRNISSFQGHPVTVHPAD